MEQSSISISSAEQPAIAPLFEIASIRDVQIWLNEKNAAISSSAEAQNILEAVALLSQPKPRLKDVRALQTRWKVPQTINKKIMLLEDVIKKLKSKVIEAAQKLQVQLAGSAEQSAAAASSSDGADVHDEFVVDENCLSSAVLPSVQSLTPLPILLGSQGIATAELAQAVPAATATASTATESPEPARTTSSTYTWQAASAIQWPACRMINNDAALHSLQIGDTTAFELQEAKEQRDWSMEPSTETACKLLATFARTSTGVPDLDENETFWQLNFVEVTQPPQDQKVKSTDGTRLWFPVTLRDHSGSIMLYITEAAALKLANVADVTEFEQLFSENRLRFPFLASVKVWRRPSKLRAEQSDSTQTQQDKDDFDCFIVDASEQDMKETLSLHSILLLPMFAGLVPRIVSQRSQGLQCWTACL